MSDRLLEIAGRFARLGCVAFGGPAAHIAMMEDEFVEHRQWVSRQHFLDLMGATNLIPGPNSTQMTMHLGYERGGAVGLVVAGLCFIVPAATMTGVLAWAYVEYGRLPAVEPFLVGIKPAVIAVIAGALWKLGKKAIKGWKLVPIGLGAGVAVLLGVGEITALAAASLLGTVWLRLRIGGAAGLIGLAPLLLWRPPSVFAATAAAAVPLWKLGLFFLKIGAILYGSGYVLIAFLEGGLVQRLGWLTHDQLLDAVAVGQFTPGPVLTTATFIGYVLAGAPGAVVATIGMFLPSFVFVALLNPLIPKMRRSAWSAAFLDAVNAAALGLMAAVVIELSLTTLVSWQAAAIGAAAAAGVFIWRLNAAWLVLGGAVLGWVLM